MLRLVNFSLNTSSTQLLDSVNTVITEGEVVGLVGSNGSGKSTLLRVISEYNFNEVSKVKTKSKISEKGKTKKKESLNKNNMESELISSSSEYWTISSGSIDGKISKLNENSILHVHQDILSWTKLFPNIEMKENELISLSIQEILDTCISFDVENSIEEEEEWRKLYSHCSIELNWNLSDYDNKPICELSPGSALRAYISIALLRPSIKLLLLDEPTNHLDLASILWLQSMISNSSKTMIIISHDIDFLDNVVNRVWEIDSSTASLTSTLSKYSDWIVAKRKALEAQKKAYVEQQKRHAKITKTVNSLKTASTQGQQFQSKDNDKLQRDFFRNKAGGSGKKAAVLEKARDSETKIEKVVERPPLQLRLDPIAAGMDSSIMLDEVKLGYKSYTLSIPPITLRIDFGERVAITGFNSVGKSTLLKTLAGDLPPISGGVKIGRELRIGNLMQEHETLSRSKTPREFLKNDLGLDAFVSGSRIINYGLSRDQVDLPISDLNPGARVRLLLATFSFRKVNTLILDEPSNHLDIEGVNELLSSISTFKGTVLVVSHDRHFLSSLAPTSTLLLTPDKGLTQIDSMNTFIDEIQEKVDHIILKTTKKK